MCASDFAAAKDQATRTQEISRERGLIFTQDGHNKGSVAFAHALLEAAPDRIVWGSDWPHVMTRWTIPMPNDGALADLLLDWIPDAPQRDRVLTDNPAALYGWT